MLKFTLKGKAGRTVLGLGVEKGNLDRLMEQLPLVVHAEDFGMKGFDILVVYGHTLIDVRNYLEHELKLKGLPKMDQPEPPEVRQVWDALMARYRDLVGDDTEEMAELERRFNQAVAH